MADMNQIYSFINDVTAECFGEQAISVKDTSSLVSLGDLVLSTADNRDIFYKKLADRIGRVVVYTMNIRRVTRGIVVTPLTFGAALQRIAIHKIARTEEYSAWKVKQGSPFEKEEDDTDFIVQIFKKFAGIEVDKIVLDRQLRTAFTSAAALSAFVSMIFDDMRNGIIQGLNGMDITAECTAIAQSYAHGGQTSVNLRTLYNMTHTTPINTVDCSESAEFLKFAAKRIKRTYNQMIDATPSVFYNVTGSERTNSESEMHMHMLSDFAESMAFYLQADTYHDEYVKLTGYEEVSFWQSRGLTGEWDDITAIHIENEEDEDGVSPLNIPEVDFNGMVCHIFADGRVGQMVKDIETASMYNPKYKRTNYYHTAEAGYMVVPDIQGVIFYINDEADDYTALATEPLDWATDYEDYYYMEGTTFKPVTGDSAPTFEANKYFSKS